MPTHEFSISKEPKKKGGRKTPPMLDEVYGKLTVKEPFGSDGKDFYWMCQCACGGTKKVSTGELRSGHTQSCGCLARRGFGQSALHSTFRNYQRGAIARGLAFELNKEQFTKLLSGNCEYCGSPPTQTLRKKGGHGYLTYNGIDRVDNTKPYTIENTVPCCGKCNFAKARLTLDEFKEHVMKMYRHLFMARTS